jgi:hypothetical protein
VGQSMLATVAIQSPRISRWSAGAAVSAGGGVTGGGPVISPDEPLHAEMIANDAASANLLSG